MSKLDKFLKESSLSDAAKQLIQEAWNEEKADIAAEIRQEMKSRYNDDMAKLTESVDQMITGVISTELSEVYAEKRKLVEDRVRVRQSLNTFSGFANGVIAEEVKSMRKETKHIKENLSKFMNFSNNILAEELAEFHHEKRQLVESRVKLISEGSRKIAEARETYIKRASESAATFIAESTERHLNELKTDIVEAKQNMFGRKIFEAFSNEFNSKQYNESSMLRQLSESVNKKEDEVLATRMQLQEAKNKIADAERKVRIMEDKQARGAIVSELTKPLTSQQKQIMESLLSATPTEKLRDDFKKYHKSVMNGTLNESAKSSRAATNQAKTTLSEGTVVTGNRERTFINESEELDSDDLAFLQELEKNAGIRK